MIRAALERAWWRRRPGLLAGLLWPLSLLYGAVSGARRWAYRAGVLRATRLSVPVVIVGNLIVGGAGKTPTVIAIVEWLMAQGWSPGVVSRGFGRDSAAIERAGPQSTADQVGDEPLLIHRRTGAPLMVGRDRAAAAAMLIQQQPGIDLIVSDDGLQHDALARDVEVIVFDRRGAGNGLLLPAGPLREPLMRGSPSGSALVLYNAGTASTPLPGHLARRDLTGAASLADWRAGGKFAMACLHALRGRPLVAVAGIAEPERFFGMLEHEGLSISRLPLPDHARFDRLPWTADTADVVLTEKDAVKLDPAAIEAAGATRVWVVGLDFSLPVAFLDALNAKLASLRT